MYDEYRARFRTTTAEGVHDGDTFELLIDTGFNGWTEQWIRLLGVDAVELNSLNGKNARAWAIEWFEENMDSDGYVYIYPQKNTKGNDVKSFARWVAAIYSQPNKSGRSMAADLRASIYVKGK